jgi:DNA (cytosine-5)-methyltransferase 1
MNEQGTHIDLFSGIGGFALAARWTGFKTVAFCECEPYAKRVLRKHWPDVPIYDDVRTFPGERYAGATLLTGGFPCQPFSLAGKRAGTDDDRYLWPEMLRVIREARPTWVLGENVPGIVKMALDEVCVGLEREGYSVQPIGIPACAVGAWHKRQRIWIMAHNERDTHGGANRTRRGELEQVLVEETRIGEDGNWDSECGMGRMVHGVSNGSHRLRGLGNAIVPQVAAELMRMICTVEQRDTPQ